MRIETTLRAVGQEVKDFASELVEPFAKSIREIRHDTQSQIAIVIVIATVGIVGRLEVLLAPPAEENSSDIVDPVEETDVMAEVAIATCDEHYKAKPPFYCPEEVVAIIKANFRRMAEEEDEGTALIIGTPNLAEFERLCNEK